jgi:hypothetical protein
MIKKDLSTTLKRGLIKNKVLILLDSNARVKIGKEPLITQEEGDKIRDSLKAPYEIRVYNKLIQIEKNIAYQMINLSLMSVDVARFVSEVKGAILVWEVSEEAEELANYLLYEIKDLEERRRIAEAGVKRSNILFIDLSVDNEGFIKTDPDGKKGSSNLRENINNIVKTLILVSSRYNTLRKVILDYMEETGVKIRTYIEEIKSYDYRAYDFTLDKYSLQKKTFFKLPHRVDNQKNYYSIVPDLREIEIDPKLYDSYYRSINK